MSKGKVITLVVVGCILLAVANVALWATLDVFNSERFGAKVAEGLQSPAATEALAESIVDQLLEEDLRLHPLARGAATEAVAWLLQRPVFTLIYMETATAAINIMTTSAQDVVGIDLADVISEVGDTIVGVISVLDEESGASAEAALDEALTASSESGKLAFYEKGKFPQMRQLARMSPWLALLAGLGAVALFVVAYKQAKDQLRALEYTGVGVMFTAGLTFLLLAPGVQAIAQNNIVNPTMQIVVSEVVSVLMRGVAIQSLLLFFIGLIVYLVYHAQTKKDEPAQASPAE